MLAADGTPFGVQGNTLTPAQEREQRQRSMRFVMMFLLMLTLMDSEENQRQIHHQTQLRSKAPINQASMERGLYESRQLQDARIESSSRGHPRYAYLMNRNDKVDYNLEVEEFALRRPEKEEILKSQEGDGGEGTRKVWHYPWNATGVYRGEWKQRLSMNSTTPSTIPSSKNNRTKSEWKIVEPFLLENQAMEWIHAGGPGVVLLPDHLMMEVANGTELDSRKPILPPPPTFLRGATAAIQEHHDPFQLPLEHQSGRVAFQLYSRTVPAMHELSILDGFVKLYDSDSFGYSTDRDVVLRVHGVLIHALGHISLTSALSLGRTALIVPTPPPTSSTTTTSPPAAVSERRLQQIVDGANIEEIRDAVLAIHSPINANLDSNPDWHSSSIVSLNPMEQEHRRLQQQAVTNLTNSANTTANFSDIVFPFPFVRDDEYDSFAMAKTPADRLKPRDQHLEVNAGECEFTLSLNVQEEEWSIFEWKKLLARQIKELDKLHPDYDKPENKKKKKNKRRPEDQALVMTLNGTISSSNCDFVADVNATAIRIDWDKTTGKAVNYSFYMMMTCLAQIVLLLRQLLFSQATSAAIRVSLVGIGWQTVLDGLLCLVHVYLSLAVQPIFTAFASVAFFKLLIFCVIEMKYMAMVVQARNSNSGGNAEPLRRQIAMMHLRFYVALMGTLIIFLYAWDKYKIIYMLVLYSFWWPQIIYNVVTEAKGPLHRHYVYGMSISRLAAPLYVFVVPDNFVKELFQQSPTNYFMFELLVVWIGIQAALLEAQRRYGARFFIPARFLPPKFDYNRPIPAYLLPNEHKEEVSATPSESLQKERGKTTEIRTPVVARESTSRGARNRMKGNRGPESVSMTTETISEPPTRPVLPSFECAICYTEIDVRNRSGYMLAPCDHLFHKDCLAQWMEIKMECPICRKELPAL